ncbi:hypothetical protein ACOSP7_018564 [Xanthoceras sorbifolium]
MEQTAIDQLCEALASSELEGPVASLDDSLQEVGARKLAMSLVGKVLTNKLVNREAFRLIIPRIWRTTQPVEVESLGENIFAFYFKNKLNRKRVLMGGPWSFDRSLLVIEEPKGNGDISRMRFEKSEFWIKIHNVPLLCMTRDIGLFLGKQIGVVRELDLGASGDCVGRYIRVRVVVDVLRPLRRCIKVDIDASGKPMIMLLRYERMPEYCFHCGLLGHSVRDCPIVETDNVEESQNYDYGSWLRATSPVRFSRQSRESEAQGGVPLSPKSSNKCENFPSPPREVRV